MISIPTDDFYKFWAVSGLVAFVFFFWFLEGQIVALEDRYYETRLAAVEIRTEGERLKYNSLRIKNKLENLPAAEANGVDLHKGFLQGLQIEVGDLNEDYFRYFSLEHKFNVNKEYLEIVLNRVKFYRNLSCFSFLFLFMSVLGFWFWYKDAHSKRCSMNGHSPGRVDQ